MPDSTQNQEIISAEKSSVEQQSGTTETRPPASSGCSLTAIVACICCTIVVLGGLYTIIHTEDNGTKIIEKVTDKPFEFLKYCVDRIFTPSSTEMYVITTKGGHRVLELNTYTKEYVGEGLIETTWLGSTKQLNYKQNYEVKYGILLDSLKLKFNTSTFDFEDNAGNIIITGMTPVGEPIIKSNDGLWNKITDAERIKVEAKALAYAKSEANRNEEAKRMAFSYFLDFLNKIAVEQHQDFQYTLD